MDAPPPPYEEAIAGSSSTTNRPPPQQQDSQGHLKIRNGIPPSMRRSMEDEGRPLPEGWVRSYDPENDHHFYVDTKSDPPRSIWQHPYDDANYLRSLSEKERARITSMHRTPSEADIAAESSEDDDHTEPHKQPRLPNKAAAGGSAADEPAAGPSNSAPKGGTSKFGRKLKDKLTNSTHEQREAERKQRAIEEQHYYEQHLMIRNAMAEAVRTGQPQFIGKDPRTGQDLYLEPPTGPRPPPGAHGINPYAQGPYANPNAKFVRPRDPYSRPYGGGYGGGYGLPLAGGLAGGMMGGLLLGDMMGGGMGMGGMGMGGGGM